MPFLHILVSGMPDTSLAGRIATTASELTAQILGKDPAATAVAVDFIPAAHWYVAGRAAPESQRRAFYWTVSITDETNTKTEKAIYLAAVHAAMDDLLGGALEHSYTHVIDVRATAYGFGGLTQERRYQRL